MVDFPKDPYERHIIFRQELGAAALAAASIPNIVAQYRLALSSYQEHGPMGPVFSQAPVWIQRFYDPRSSVGHYLRSVLGGLSSGDSRSASSISQSAMGFGSVTSLGYLLSQGLRFYGNFGMFQSSSSGLEKTIVVGDSVSLLFAITKSLHFLLGAKRARSRISAESVLKFQRAQRFVVFSSACYAVVGVFKLLREYLRPHENPPTSPKLSTVIYSTMDIANGVSGALAASYFLSLSQSFAERGNWVEAQATALGFAKWNRQAKLSGRWLPIISGCLALAVSGYHYLVSEDENQRKSAKLGLAIGSLNIGAAYFAFPASGFLSSILMVPSLLLGIWQTSIDCRKK